MARSSILPRDLRALFWAEKRALKFCLSAPAQIELYRPPRSRKTSPQRRRVHILELRELVPNLFANVCIRQMRILLLGFQEQPTQHEEMPGIPFLRTLAPTTFVAFEMSLCEISQ
jgi:hypothetical protein